MNDEARMPNVGDRTNAWRRTAGGWVCGRNLLDTRREAGIIEVSIQKVIEERSDDIAEAWRQHFRR
jgi:hypothetical protein